MIKNFIQLFNLFEKETKIKIILFQFFVVFSSFLEVISFGSLIPFFTIIADPEIINKNEYAIIIKNYFNLDDNFEFIKLLGISVIFLVVLSNAILLFSIFVVSFFGQKIGMRLSHRIYTFYLNKNYTFFTNNDSSFLSARITNESIRIADGVITASMIIFSRLVFAFVIVISLLIIDFYTSLIVVIFFSSAYILIYLSIKKFISSIGKKTTKSNENWYRYIHESFNAIKELIVLDRLKYYDFNVKLINNNLANYKAWNMVLGQSPRYFIEVIAFVLLLGFLISFVSDQTTFISLIPFLSLYAIAGYKLLPTFQVIYYHYNHLKYHIEAYENLKPDIININEIDKTNIILKNQYNEINFNKKIELNNVEYFIKNKIENKKILSNINATFYKNSLNAIIGLSGSGKTTIMDIILGLRIPSSGNILIDNKKLDASNHLSWRKKIGYVPQKIFIFNGNIIENICIGISKENYNIQKASECLKIAGLDEFATIDNQGLYRNIGEKGLKISGGQIQRIGIARSLYNNPDILVFDEATSSLDAVSEKKFYKTLEKLSNNNKTIILISHKVDYLKKFKNILLIENGNLYKSGDYFEMKKYDKFQKLLINDQELIDE